MRRRRTAAQQHRIARFQCEAERVDGDVRPALVDDADHAERHPLLAQPQSIGQGPPAQHLADRVGQARDLSQTGRDAVDAMWVERQPVEQRFGSAGGPCRVQILGVGGQDHVHMRKQRIRRGVQRAVLVGGGQRGQHAGRGTRPSGRVVDVLTQVGARSVACRLINPGYRANRPVGRPGLT